MVGVPVAVVILLGAPGEAGSSFLGAGPLPFPEPLTTWPDLSWPLSHSATLSLRQLLPPVPSFQSPHHPWHLCSLFGRNWRLPAKYLGQGTASY